MNLIDMYAVVVQSRLGIAPKEVFGNFPLSIADPPQVPVDFSHAFVELFPGFSYLLVIFPDALIELLPGFSHLLVILPDALIELFPRFLEIPIELRARFCQLLVKTIHSRFGFRRSRFGFRNSRFGFRRRVFLDFADLVSNAFEIVEERIVHNPTILFD